MSERENEVGTTELPSALGLADSTNPTDTSEEEARELVLRAKEGDVEVAYAVLGRQVAVNLWVAVRHQLASNPGAVDLELVAHPNEKVLP